MTRIALTHLCLLAFAVGCATTKAAPEASSLRDARARVYSGYYEFGFELATFTPCNVPETWWVAAGERSAFQPLTDFVNRNYAEFHTGRIRGGRVFVRWRGTPSLDGRYGHRSSYAREFRVIQILEVRWPMPGDCARSTSVVLPRNQTLSARDGPGRRSGERATEDHVESNRWG